MPLLLLHHDRFFIHPEFRKNLRNCDRMDQIRLTGFAELPFVHLFRDIKSFPDAIEIILEDHGPGIPDVELAMQEGYSTSTEQIRNMGFGAGMGLPNMKRYTESLEIETKVGVGTKLTMVVGV